MSIGLNSDCLGTSINSVAHYLFVLGHTGDKAGVLSIDLCEN